MKLLKQPAFPCHADRHKVARSTHLGSFIFLDVFLHCNCVQCIWRWFMNKNQKIFRLQVRKTDYPESIPVLTQKAYSQRIAAKRDNLLDYF